MYKNLPDKLKVIHLDKDLYPLHKSGTVVSDFGMDNTSVLLENGFGLYSTNGLQKPIGPIKTQYFRISLTRSGSAQFGIGLEKFRTQRNTILFGIPGQVFSISNFSDDFVAYYVLFTEAFIGDIFLKQKRNQRYPFLSYAGCQCFQVDDRTGDELESIYFKMNDEINASKSGCSDMVRLFIQQIVLLANRCYSSAMLSKHPTSNAIQSLYHEFLKLVSQHFLSVRKVSSYAEMLHVSPDHLNRAVRSSSDRTANAHIDEMLILEAKAHLLYTSMTIAEIAYALEFSDPSHFNRFFKKHSGQTPVEFRGRA